MKKEYKTPQSYIHKLALPIMDSIGWGGSVPDGEANESKRNSFIFDDDIEESMEFHHETSICYPFDL